MITLKDKLSHLSYQEACKLLGAKGKSLIIEGGKYDVDIYDQVTINDNYFELNLGEAVVGISMNPEKHQQLDINCSLCTGFCEHKGAAFALIGEMFSAEEESEKTVELAGAFKAKLLDCLEKGDDGELKMTIAIQDEGMLDNMAQSLAKMVGARI